MFDIKKLPDGRCLGVDVIEINGFPHIPDDNIEQKNHIQEEIIQFRSLFNEFHSMMVDESAVLEILWFAKPVINKGYKSEIKIYIIIRKIAGNNTLVENYLIAFHNRIVSMLKSRDYDINPIISEKMINNFKDIDLNAAYSIKKQIRCSISPSYQTPLFFCDVLDGDKIHNFESIVTTLSNYKNCVISFQLFPTSLSVQEKLVLSEVLNYYQNIYSGRYAGAFLGVDKASEEAVESVNSYYNKSEDGLFNYNISVYGDNNACLSVINLFKGLLSNIKEKNVLFDIINIKGKGTDLSEDFYTYPWNSLSKISKEVCRAPISNNAEYIIKKISLIMTNEEVTAFLRLPNYSSTTLSLKEKQDYELTESLDDSVVNDDNIQFGSIKAVDEELEIGCPPNEFTKHALIVGTPGTGKTTFSLNLLLQFYKHGIPFLAIEPTKTEYRTLIEKISDLQIFTPGNSELSPFIINPFIPPTGIKVEQYIPALYSAFNAAFSMPNPLDVIFMKAIRTAYILYGWKDYSKTGDYDVKPFGLYEFVLIFKKLVKESSYAKEIKGNLEGAGTIRLMNLIEQNGNIFDTLKTIPIEDLLRKPTIVELNAIQDQEQKALIMALLLSNICIYTKIVQKGDGTLKNVMLIDEAHVLLDSSDNKKDEYKSDAKGVTVKSLQNMVAEIRSYGTSVIIADQSVTKVGSDIVANTDIKIVFRLVDKKQKEAITDSINGTKEIYEKLSKLKKGQAFVFWSSFNSPQFIYTTDIRQREKLDISVSDDVIIKKMNYWKDKKDILMPFMLCDHCDECKSGCDYYIKSDARNYAENIFYSCKDRITDPKMFLRYLVSVPELLDNYKGKYDKKAFERLINCTRIFFSRKIQLEKGFKVKDQDMILIFKKMRGG